MDKLRIAVIGCGWAGERHVLAFQALSDRAEIVALVDNDRDYLDVKAAEWDIPDFCTDYREVLERKDVHAVSLCLPHNIHADVAVASAQAGKHILCEKPIAVTLKEADSMIASAEENRIKLMVAESARFNPKYRSVKNCLDRNCIGNPILLRFVFIPRRGSKEGYVYPGRRSWLTDSKIAGGGQWMVNGIHRVSVARWFFGEVKSIYAAEHRTPSYRLDIEANVCATLKFENGALGEILSIPQASHYEVFNDTMVHGDAGAIVVSRTDGKVHLHGGQMESPDNHRILDTAEDEDAFALEMEHFLDYVQNDAPCICDGRSERASLAVVLGGFASMKSGAEVICDRL
jgi:predicted dehydrogenase